MACTEIALYTCEGERLNAEDIVDLQWQRDINAPCDSLGFSCACGDLPEVDRAELYINGKKVFFGFCDTQREVRRDGVKSTYLYARSSACLLLDSEALPTTYSTPCTSSLFRLNAERFGFINRLKSLYSEYDYVVQKGVSCFGAINNFVSGLTGRSIAVSPDNEIYLPSGREVFKVDESRLVCVTKRINRGEALSAVEYKAQGDLSYRHRIKSRSVEALGIDRSVKLNLSAVPEWQRDFTLRRMLRKSVEEYKTATFEFNSAATPELYSEVKGGGLDGYYVSAVTLSVADGMVRTSVKCNKNIDIKEINYVAE